MKFDKWILRILSIAMFGTILAIHRRHQEGVGIPPPQLLNEGAAPGDAHRASALAFYRKYPPPEWGYHVIEKIADHGIRIHPIPPDQVDFMQNFELWDRGRRIAEEATRHSLG